MTTFDLGFLPSFITQPDSQALCAEVDPEVWFPEQGGKNTLAKMLCGRCELEDDCLDWALTTRQDWGIWGGKSENERRRILRAAAVRSPAKPIQHGTEAGYKSHRRRGEFVPKEDLCGCRAAHRRANEERRIAAEEQVAS